jgi:hypothetical protein
VARKKKQKTLLFSAKKSVYYPVVGALLEIFDDLPNSHGIYDYTFVDGEVIFRVVIEDSKHDRGAIHFHWAHKQGEM